MNSIVVHYQEIALKGKNRPWFVARLAQNLRAALADLDVPKVRVLMGRFEVVLGPGATFEQVGDRLRRVFGVANFARAGRTTPDVETVAAAILRDLGDHETSSFRVSARRADKRFPLTSPQIEREVGGRIKQAKGWRVSLDAPELDIRVEFLTDEVFYFFGKERGPGGLPVGSSGRVVCLMSGGIDSPVAACRMMKRGCSVRLVHFHSYPFLSRASQEKAHELAELLTRYQLRTKLYLVPFGEIQRQVVLTAPAPLRVVIYRRLMLRIAERIAREDGAKALVTGEVIGQVASQTLDNLSVIASAATLPILRPLVGMDKDEIVAEAQALGTFPISIVPDQDCCQLFTPRRPATRSRVAEVEAAEGLLPVEAMVGQAVAGAVVEQFRYPAQPAAERE